MQQAGARRLRADDEQAPRPARRSLYVVEAPPDGARPRGPRDPHAHGSAQPHSTPDPQRRTVLITGQAAPLRRRRPSASVQVSARPDRVALWAFLLGLFLVFMAVATASAATV
jgi:hypothetical protein